MASLKQLAGQTIWYGVSNIAAKLLNQLLTPIITYILNNPSGMVAYGDLTMLYSFIALVNVLYTYGLETAYFRFASKGTDKTGLFNTTFSSLLMSTLAFSALLIWLREPIADYIELGGHSEYVTLCVLIIAIDTLAAIPFARLRQEGRPRKYAIVRVAGIIVNIVLTVYLMAYCPNQVAAHPETEFAKWYTGNSPVGFLLWANLGQAFITFLLLFKEWSGYRMRFDTALWKQIFKYSWPMVIVGMGGMVNETVDRIMLGKLYIGTPEQQKIAVGIYSANYKIAIFISLFIQAFKMSAEPFFFSRSADRNAATTYARVMKWFVITLCCAFLFTALYIDLWKYFIGSQYREGLGVVPILLAANVALGIYYNLAVWYKITDRMYMGMIITIVGAVLTLTLNYIFIPIYGMYACAWTTLAAYTIMMVVCYVMGQHYFPVNYQVGRLGRYIGLMLLFFGIQWGVMHFTAVLPLRLASATVLMLAFVGIVLRTEKDELAAMPVIGRWLR
ncbi:polysaccharide biosynthesis C-terminal domain-containing protein [Nemorincola caseinilytica]|uniref:Polysaccharide biosynthesis C-terminal domain-containing protein n=1 Tax=Nemorincola caseinilytica TaxID=2054315 RepID=A0ABP8NHE8_9BACT